MDTMFCNFSQAITTTKELEKAVNEFNQFFAYSDLADFPDLIAQYLLFIKYSGYDRVTCTRTLRYKIQCIISPFYSLDGVCILCTMCKVDSLQVDYILEKKLKDFDKDLRILFYNIMSSEIFHFTDYYYTDDFYNGIKVIFKSIGHLIISKRLPKSEIKKYISSILINCLATILSDRNFNHNLENSIKILEIIFNHFEIFGDNWILQATAFFTDYTIKHFQLIDQSLDEKRVEVLYKTFFLKYEKYIVMNGMTYRLSRMACMYVGYFSKQYTDAKVRNNIISFFDFFIPDDLVYVYFEYILPTERVNNIRIKILDTFLNLQLSHKDDMIVMSKYIFDNLKKISDGDKCNIVREKCLEYILNTSKEEKKYFIPLLISRLQDVCETVQTKALNMFLSYHVQDEIELIGKENMLKTMQMFAYIKKTTTNKEIACLCEMIINKDCYNHKDLYNYGSEKQNIAYLK